MFGVIGVMTIHGIYIENIFNTVSSTYNLFSSYLGTGSSTEMVSTSTSNI